MLANARIVENGGGKDNPPVGCVKRTIWRVDRRELHYRPKAADTFQLPQIRPVAGTCPVLQTAIHRTD